MLWHPETTTDPVFRPIISRMIFLIEYNRPEGRLVTFERFQDSERLKAQNARLGLELDLNRRGINHEVVLLEAASEGAVRRTHRGYFETPRQIAESIALAINRTIRSLYPNPDKTKA